MKGFRCIRLKEYSVTFLFVLSLVSSLASSFLPSQEASAYGGISDPFATNEEILDFAVAHGPSGFPTKSQLKGADYNWAVASYEPDESTFLFYFGQNDDFIIENGGPPDTFSINGKLCRWNKDLSGGPGCNPIENEYSLTSEFLYALKLTSGEASYVIENDPTLYFYIQEILLTTTRETIRPDIKVEVNDKTVTLTDVSSPPDDVTPYALHAVVTVGTFETSVEFLEADIAEGEEAEVTVSNYAPSSVQVYYTELDGTRRPSSNLYDYRETVVTFEIDGSSFVIDTTGTVCDENDLCTPPDEPEYEDCFAYGTDLIGGFQCIVGNIGKFLGNFFASLFKPDPAFTKQMVDLFKNFTTDTYGLTAVLSAPFGLLSTIQEQTYNCVAINLPFPFSGGTLTLPCMGSTYASKFGAAFTLYQVIVTAGISYYVLLGILKQVKNMKDPENDRIEAHQL